MREIKFRAWDNANKRYASKGVSLAIYEFKGKFRIINPLGLELELYTGRKDGNDEEIYDGDIVKWYPENYYWEDVIPEPNGKGEYIAQIVWHDESARFCFETNGNLNWINDGSFPECEIIGNIHTTPELLNG